MHESWQSPGEKTIAKHSNSRSFTISKIFLWPSFHLALPKRSSSFQLRKLRPGGHFLCWRPSLWPSTQPSISALFWYITGDSGIPPGGSVVKNSPTYTGDTDWIPRSGRSPGGGNGNPLQYSCLGNPMDREAWWVSGSQRARHNWACMHARDFILDPALGERFRKMLQPSA